MDDLDILLSEYMRLKKQELMFISQGFANHAAVSRRSREALSRQIHNLTRTSKKGVQPCPCPA